MTRPIDVHYGYGLHVPDTDLFRPEYLVTEPDGMTAKIFSVLPDFLLVGNSAHLISADYYFRTQSRLWSVNRQHQFTEISLNEEPTGVLPLQEEPLLFGDTNRTYDDVIDNLRQIYGRYLVDNFDFEKHFVKYEIVDI